MSSDLTPKQEKFCQKYIETGNASEAAIKLKSYYVYHLVDPIDEEVFYVGKGSGNRAYHHERDALHLRNLNPAKELRIRMIRKRGGSVEIRKVYETNSEAEAFEVEREHIERIGYHKLTNQAKSTRSAGVNSYLHGMAFIDSVRRNLAAGRVPPHKVNVFRGLVAEIQENLDWIESLVGKKAIALALQKAKAA